MSAPEIDEGKVFAAFDDLADAPDVTLVLSQPILWVVLAQLQLALRHPKNTNVTADLARDFALRIQAIVAPPGSPLGDLAEAGWHGDGDGG